MDKGRRNEIEQLKWIRRLKLRGIPLKEKKKFTCYKTTGNPCGCFGCKPPKYNRAKQKNFES